MKKILKLIIRIFIVVTIVAGIILYGVYKKYETILSTALNSSSEKIEFIVEAGSDTDDIIDSLSEADLIPESSTEFIKKYSKFAKLPEIKEGTFTIPKDLTPFEILELLQNPDN